MSYSRNSQSSGDNPKKDKSHNYRFCPL